MKQYVTSTAHATHRAHSYIMFPGGHVSKHTDRQTDTHTQTHYCC